MTLNGIDVSAAGQGTQFDWAPHKGSAHFAFTKVSEGVGYGDPSAKRNIEQMRAEGITAGGYHFLHAGQPGGAQAEAFLSHAKAAGLKPGDLIALDAEDLGLDGGTPARMNQVASAFCTELRLHFPGFWPELYTEIHLAPAFTSLGNCPLWLANPSGTPVTSIGPWKQVSFQQVGQRGVDTDVFYGTPAQLAALAIPR
jgi:lysozyme